MVTGIKLQRRIQTALVYILTIIACIIALMPFLWMISTSFKDRSEIFTYPPVIIPREPTLEAYTGLMDQSIFANAGFIDFTKNSLFVSLFTAFSSVTMASLAGFSMSRFRFRGSSFLRYSILLSQMLPGALLLIPLYLFVNSLGLIDSHWSLILAYTSFTLPYCTYILKGYFESIPADLDEAAMVDGCTRIGALFRVVMPLAAPGIVVTLTSAFIMAWNEFMFAMTFLNTYPQWTLPLALGSFRGQYLVDWGFLFAASTLVTLPVLVLFLLLQKWLAAGFVSGAVKG
jgi:ABC-type glycerol-3-phosphate transport system permease component